MQIETAAEIAVKKKTPDLRAYAALVLAGWLILVTAGILYGRLRQIPMATAVPIIVAFAIELPLYLAPFFASVRGVLERMNAWMVAAGLAVTALLPYLVYSVPTARFDAFALYRLAGLAITLSFWYLVLPRRAWSDILFLAGPAAILISKVLKAVYVSPLPHERIDILGKLMLIHVAAVAVLVLRGLPGVNPGLWPTKREAWTGVRAFLLFVPIGFALLRLMHSPERAHPLAAWMAAPIFMGAYLVPAWSEEFAVRGILQQHLTGALGVPAGVAIASVLFGLAHLNFGIFPNWRMVVLAGVAGGFYGLAYRYSGSIRASMLTHALTVTAWTLWFR